MCIHPARSVSQRVNRGGHDTSWPDEQAFSAAALGDPRTARATRLGTATGSLVLSDGCERARDRAVDAPQDERGACGPASALRLL